MSGRCATKILSKRGRREELGASESTGDSRSCRRQWRRDGLDLEQPGGGEFRVLGVERRGARGLYMDTEEHNKSRPNRPDLDSEIETAPDLCEEVEGDDVSLRHRWARLAERGKKRKRGKKEGRGAGRRWAGVGPSRLAEVGCGLFYFFLTKL